jgi:ribosomal protein S18 acetylase RimI-like enzyme
MSVRLPALTIRDATSRDIGPILRLWVEAGSVATVTDNHESLAVLVESRHGDLLVAETGEHVVGSLIVGWDGWRGSLYRLAVGPDHRRQGVAAALVAEGERRLHRHGAVRLNVVVVADAPAAMGFWAAVGYEHQPGQARFVRNLSRG